MENYCWLQKNSEIVQVEFSFCLVPLPDCLIELLSKLIWFWNKQTATKFLKSTKNLRAESSRLLKWNIKNLCCNLQKFHKRNYYRKHRKKEQNTDKWYSESWKPIEQSAKVFYDSPSKFFMLFSYLPCEKMTRILLSQKFILLLYLNKLSSQMQDNLNMPSLQSSVTSVSSVNIVYRYTFQTGK